MPVKITYNGVATEYTEDVKTLKCSGKKMKSDVVIDIAGGEVEKDIKSFIIMDANSYNAGNNEYVDMGAYEEGMTWEEFINSDYNTIYLNISPSGYVRVTYGYMDTNLLKYYNGSLSSIKGTEKISNEKYYAYYTGSGSGGSN